MTKTNAANNAIIALTLLGLPFSMAPLCKLGVPVTDALVPAVAACSVARTTVKDVTVLRLPLGSVVVKRICSVVEDSTATIPEVCPPNDSPADVEAEFEFALPVAVAPADNEPPMTDVPVPVVLAAVEPCDGDELAWLD